jgi:hypothetical protein
MAVHRLSVATGLGLRQYLRNPLLIILLVIMPPSFITLSFIVTPDVGAIVGLTEDGQTLQRDVGMVNLHGAIMVPITTAFLGGLLGLFVMLNSREADRRLVNVGYPLGGLLAVRLAIIAGFSVFITVLSVGVTLIDFEPDQLGLFVVINLISTLQYAFLGAIIGTFLSPMAGTYLVFFAPMIDIGVIQNPMFPRETLAWWTKFLPGYGPMEVLLDASFTEHFDTSAELGVSILYLAVLGGFGFLAFWRAIVPRHRASHPSGADPSAARDPMPA